MAHLLIVDNDARIVELTAFFLTHEGHEVETALSYAEARGCIDARRPELMLADLDLGVEHGREELPRLADEGRLPPTLVVSGFLDAELEAELSALPAVCGTLTKPIDLDRLAQRILDELASDVLVPRPEPLVPEPLVPEPVMPEPVTPESAARDEEEDDDEGWVEIVPLDPWVAPAPPAVPTLPDEETS
jgi:CheY-like chemotaxis protein